MKISRRSIEFAWHVGAFVLLLGAFVPLWRQTVGGVVDTEDGDLVMRAILAVAFLAVGLLISQPGKALHTARKAPIIWMLVVLVFLSSLWSSAPDVTLRRAVSVTLAALYGILLAVRYPFLDVLRMLGVALAIAVLASLAAVLLLPEVAVMDAHPHIGAWQGVLYHKNALGRTSAMALIVFLFLFSDGMGINRWRWLLLAAAASITLIGSRSATAMGITLIVGITWLLIRQMRRMPRPLQPALASLGMAAAILVAVILPNYLEELLGLFGRDLTLTGRFPLWASSVPLALQRPLLGYGFGSFWLGWAGPSAQVWEVTWHATHAHNGYLDLWLEIGLVGLTLIMALLVTTLIRAVQGIYREVGNLIFGFAFIVAVFFATANASQSMFLKSGLGRSFYWILFSYIYLLTNPSVPSKSNLRKRRSTRHF